MYRVFVARADHHRADIASFQTEKEAKARAEALCKEIDEDEDHYFQSGNVCIEFPDGTVQMFTDEWEQVDD